MSLLACVTVPDGATARTLAHLVVERRLAAGVNILPGALSIYRWEGKVRESRECLLLAQVSRAAWRRPIPMKCPVSWACRWRRATRPSWTGSPKTACPQGSSTNKRNEDGHLCFRFPGF